MGLMVIKPGLATTVQDLGRPGLRGFGVPEGGAFDRESFGLANALLGNDPGCAAIELTMVGGLYRADRPMALALAGARFAVRLEQSGRITDLISPLTFSMDEGDQLDFGGAASGLRSYLAVREGWQTPVILGSRSSEARLRAGDILPAATGRVGVRRPVMAGLPGPTSLPIRLIDGPDARVPPSLVDHPYRVSLSCDRVGLRLEGAALIGFEAPERASAPVAPGAVQVAGVQVIILGIAGGTMGGYPHVAHVISADLDRLAQVRPCDVLRFERIELDEARRLDHDRRLTLAARHRTIALGAFDSAASRAD